ncbi:DUF547 domain-containing protein [Synechococcus sp. CBW1107]|uniref:DUF547 domain-containing protein n=1 Tax=Synechococcus sp. CBW1107 TaxID=2789857 RepID=UPI002AD563B2|nr:DUF547 domain-containing protein [Synechococcus sp. CBW1107]CAK6693464.1 hypothetical protein IFHNHDMJ_01428 [Synechococcus sp. CBW1107]
MNDLPAWNHLLQHYVDRAGRVDYEAWRTHHPDTLSRWLARQSADTHGRQDHIAHWINLYNAFTIQAVLSAYPIASIRPTLIGLPNWIGFLRFFQRRVHRLGNELFSLAQIENRMLRQRTGDPRIHFAIVCASLGCPLLRHEAYTPERVEAQLEQDVTRFINNPAKVTFDAERGVLYCSKIFRWYKADFLAVAPSLPDYILPRLGGVSVQDHQPRVAFLPYDWSLNQRMSS